VREIKSDFELKFIFHFSSSDPEPLRHNVSAFEELDLNDRSSELHESDIGPEVTHIYQIENKGPSDILLAQVNKD
jgi:hypothetical protein